MSNVIGQDSIVLNQSNLITSTNNNQYNYLFPGGKNFKNDKIAIKAISLYYSWKNISAAYGNNVFQIIWPILASSTTVTSTATYTITIPDGNYSIAQLDTLIQQYCIINNLYLISSTSNVYYISVQTNSNYYSVEFDFFPIPDSALQSSLSLTQPSGWPTTNTYASAFTPQLIVPPSITSNSFSSLIGYLPGTFPSSYLSTVNVGIQSTFAPQVSPVKSIIVGCSIVSNSFGMNNSVICTFAYTNTTFGQLINYTPAFAWYANVLDGSYNNLIITLWDQNFNPLPVYDSNVTIELSLVTVK